MKIDRNSWHYKFVMKNNGVFHKSEPTSLCDYARLFMCSSLIAFGRGFLKLATFVFIGIYAVCWPVMALVALSLGYYPTCFWADEWPEYDRFKITRFFRFHPGDILIISALVAFWYNIAIIAWPALVTSSIFMSLILFMYMIVLRNCYIEKWEREPKTQKSFVQGTSSTRLIYECVKSVKTKFCPLITYVDSTKIEK